MSTRKHVCELELATSPERVFELLITPSAIRGWWSATRAIVLPRAGGTWAAVWGADEDDPDYVAVATLEVFDPPQRLKFSNMQYFAKSDPLPFDSSALTTNYFIEPRSAGALLRVVQEGFSDDLIADEFYAACEKGWRDTFDGIRRFLANNP
jgi:uncharacterized protein YndB with AHSA1/START domain